MLDSPSSIVIKYLLHMHSTFVNIKYIEICIHSDKFARNQSILYVTQSTHTVHTEHHAHLFSCSFTSKQYQNPDATAGSSQDSDSDDPISITSTLSADSMDFKRSIEAMIASTDGLVNGVFKPERLLGVGRIYCVFGGRCSFLDFLCAPNDRINS